MTIRRGLEGLERVELRVMMNRGLWAALNFEVVGVISADVLRVGQSINITLWKNVTFNHEE